ncbi:MULTISPECIES: phage holin family protein [Streptomyces]|uniref:phage holin family protein n=1 Tax=Streptomyces TaxID=1883 RepID=UPI00081B4FFF|nr:MULTISPECIES: phage holin family protein [unclassified Streptomyces]MYQ51093.1 phage holin family protein [Streptomyces sp. SID4941]SCD54100.1 Putative Holin-X, holin superfamily III [Streptomyces sp. PalvLS-984]SDD89059.1 Putative Holin-X, holin superfamily III [Streptomyces sp. AmelKG-A3]
MSDPSNYPGSTDRSLGQLFASATAEMSALVHDEIALAKAEMRQDVKRGVIGSASAIVAGVLLLFSLPMLSFAAAYGIHNLGLGLAWSFLIVWGAFTLLAVLVGLFGVAKLKKVKPPQKSIASAKQTASVLQGVKPHPRATLTGELDRGGSTLPDKAIENRPVQDKASAVARSST